MRHVQGEKSRLERELEFVVKDMDKLKDAFQKEKENRSKLEQVGRILGNNKKRNCGKKKSET